MNIAITSSDGKNIDTHFGKATKFYIYEMKVPFPKFIEKRESIGYCSGSKTDHNESDKLETIYEIIKDCSMLLTVKIGNAPSTFLEKKGMSIIEVEGDIFDILKVDLSV